MKIHQLHQVPSEERRSILKFGLIIFIAPELLACGGEDDEIDGIVVEKPVRLIEALETLGWQAQEYRGWDFQGDIVLPGNTDDVTLMDPGRRIYPVVKRDGVLTLTVKPFEEVVAGLISIHNSRYVSSRNPRHSRLVERAHTMKIPMDS